MPRSARTVLHHHRCNGCGKEILRFGEAMHFFPPTTARPRLVYLSQVIPSRGPGRHSPILEAMLSTRRAARSCSRALLFTIARHCLGSPLASGIDEANHFQLNFDLIEFTAACRRDDTVVFRGRNGPRGESPKNSSFASLSDPIEISDLEQDSIVSQRIRRNSSPHVSMTARRHCNFLSAPHRGLISLE